MRAVCITGMHRSGTSMISRIVNLLGVDLGPDDELMDPKPDNPTGFWESRSITALNDDLLAQLGGSWRQVPAVDPGWEEDQRLDPYRERAAELLELLFSGSELVGWKDPRTSLLLPFWRTVVDVDRTILVVRDPRHVAASLAARDDMADAEAASLWLTYTLEAWHADPKPIIAGYEHILKDPITWASSVAAELGLPQPDAETAGAIAGFVEPSLSHHQGETGAVTPEMAQAMAVQGFLDEPDAEASMILEILYEWQRDRRRMRAAAERLEAFRQDVASLVDNRDDLIRQRDRIVAQRTQLVVERDAARAAHATTEARLDAKDRAIEAAERRLRSAGLSLASVEKELAKTQAALSEQRMLGGSIKHHMSEIVRLTMKRARGAARTDRSPA